MRGSLTSAATGRYIQLRTLRRPSLRVGAGSESGGSRWPFPEDGASLKAFQDARYADSLPERDDVGQRNNRLRD